MMIGEPAPLTPNKLIGGAVVLYLKKYLRDHASDQGTARFILNQMKPEHVAAIAQSILSDQDLAAIVEIKLPIHFVQGHELPVSILTDKRATHFRNIEISKPILLLANTGDDEEQSMKLIMPIGNQDLLLQPDLLLDVVVKDMTLTADHTYWEKSIKGLIELNRHPFERLIAYLIEVRSQIEVEGLPLIMALGAALPALMLPKDTEYFQRIAEKFRNHPSAWRKAYEAVEKQNAPFLRKQTPSQAILSTSELIVSFEKVKESIREDLHPIVESFISAPDGWNTAAEALAKCEWEDIKPLFTGLKKEKENLARETREYLDAKNSDLLNTDDSDYLKRLEKRKTSSPDDEDKSFYERHGQDLKENRKLKGAWDKFIHGSPIECEDFFEGLLLCFERFSSAGTSREKHLRLSLDRKSKNDLREANADAGSFFEFRYRGIKDLLGPKVSWDVGELFNYTGLFTGKYTRKKSRSKAALQFKFTMELSYESLTGTKYKHSTQFIWKYNPDSALSNTSADWSRLKEHPIVNCYASREALSSKGTFQSVDLYNVKSFIPTFDRDRGTFVPAYKRTNDIGKEWLENLKKARTNGHITSQVEQEILELWKHFSTLYSETIGDFMERGVSSQLLFTQARAYETLLVAICSSAKGDRNRELLLKPILKIGSIHVEGAGTTEIIAPWHPMRLLAIGVKSCRAAAYVRHFLDSEFQFGDSGKLFFKDIREEMRDAFYPEITVGWQETKPELLALSDTCGDYTLHELPYNDSKINYETSDNPAAGADCLVDLVDRYVSLQPHEKANLSVVLYNCDSARLPHAVVDKIGQLREDEDDFHCHIILRHRDDQKLRQLYERIIEISDTDPDAYNASEATRDFMARLRIGISADQKNTDHEEDGPPNDIVFSQDVIARHARIEWYFENSNPIELAKLVPIRWSRRRPAAFDDMKSVVYLCCPAHSREGWAYLTAITTFFKGDWDGNADKRLLPARQLDFNEPEMSQIFKETHDLGSWVVNFDELLDRRQLMNQNVRVIRYKQYSTHGRNLIVSSNAPLNILTAMILTRIHNLNLGLDKTAESVLAKKFIQQANDISGDIVLRAARRGRNASELMGIVLSRFLITKEIHNRIGAHSVIGWYFLDDYATWLGQREEQIADILLLCPSVDEEGKMRLDIIVTEAKYVDFSSYAAGAKNSRNQLKDTVLRLRDALFGDPLRLDRELWLGRLADLILDGVRFPASAQLNLSDWRRAIRDGTCSFRIRGYSHVFISGPADSPNVDSFSAITDLKDGYQEIYSFSQVQNLILMYSRDEDPTKMRVTGHGWEINLIESYSGSVGSISLPYSCANIIAKLDSEVSSEDKLQDLGPLDIDNAEVSKAAAIDKMGRGTPEGFVNSHDETTTGIESDFFGSHVGIDQIIEKQLVDDNDVKQQLQWLKTIENRTKEALQGFHFQAKLVDSALTPNAALLKFQGSANLTLDQVLRKQIEFKTTYGISIISVQPEPGLLSFAIERPHRQIISLEQVWYQWRELGIEAKDGIPIGLREDNGQVLLLSPQLRHAPHTLIAGSTGSGKSVLMQNIVLAIAATHSLEEAKIILIDPKLGVDYFALEDLPHLNTGIIDDQEGALKQLRLLVEEMDNRYRLFKESKVPNLLAYNKKKVKTAKLPLLWLIHDEFADWMLVDEYKQEVSAIVGRLGIKARAAGIYLVFAAQRPDANVVPIQLRANLGNRLILRVDSEGTSEIALGEKGAERLLGKGHVLVKLEGESQLLYGQVPYAAEETVRKLVSVIKARDHAN